MARTPQSISPASPRDNHTGRALLLSTLGLLSLGVVMVHSAVASVARPGAWYARLDVRHTIFAVLAGVLLCTAWRIDYHRLGRGRRFGFLPAVVLGVAIVCGVLVFVPGLGRSIGGHHRWIRIGPSQYSIGFQPSEIIKVALMVFLASWLSHRRTDPRSFKKTFLPAVGLTGLCVALIVTQDFGTAAVVGISAAVTLLLAGLPWYYLISLIPPAAMGFYLFVMRSPYRWARMVAMIDPWSQTNPSAYQPRQSLLAIITGGWFGKGPGGGMQKLGFLPEGSTDFIFSVFCEEWGFIGAMLLMSLVLIWLWHARRAAVGTSERFGQLLAGSLGFLIGIQAVLHIAVGLVAAPPTGIGLPFVSAGGTALLTTTAAATMIISVTAHRRADVKDSVIAGGD